MWHPRLDLVTVSNRVRNWLDLGVWCPIGDLDAIHLFCIVHAYSMLLTPFIMLYVAHWVVLTGIGIRAVGVPMREGKVMYGWVLSRHHVMH